MVTKKPEWLRPNKNFLWIARTNLMYKKLLLTLFFATAINALVVSPSSALHKKIRVPAVTSVEVHDQSSQTAIYTIVPWTTPSLGLTSPSASFRTDTNEYAYDKKVEIVFYLNHVLTTDYFAGKQQFKGTSSSTYNPSDTTLNSSFPNWAQDDVFPYTFGSHYVDSKKVITLQDDPGWSSPTVNFPGFGHVDEWVDNNSFRDKIKWKGSDGNYYDVYGPADPDPYFGYWTRYVDIKNNPLPSPNGTNNYFLVASGGNY